MQKKADSSERKYITLVMDVSTATGPLYHIGAGI